MSGNPDLRPLLARAQALSVLQRHFISVAPLALYCQVLSLKSGILSIAAANAAIAAKLRQLAPELVLMLQNRGCEVSGIRVKVQVSFEPPPPLTIPRHLSAKAREALKQLGQSMDDSPLKRALKKISKS